jgi:hypothetical protein
MKWLVEFYHERRGMLARYDIEAALLAEAEHPPQPPASSSPGDKSGWRPRPTPPMGSIGYTGSYREPPAGVVEVSVVSVLEARGPD